MTVNLTEIIKYEQENGFLDFKAIEYKSGTNAELVKDILAFANSNQRGDKNIIIGVKKENQEVTIIPVVNGTDSASIQQLILENITPSVHVSYEPYDYKGQNIMVLTIHDHNNRPYMLSKDLLKDGKPFHKKGAMLIRKGTTTPSMNREDLDQIYQEKQQIQASFVGKIQIEIPSSEPGIYPIKSVKGLALPSQKDKSEILDRIDELEKMLLNNSASYNAQFGNTFRRNELSGIQHMDLPQLRNELSFVQNQYAEIDHHFLAEQNGNKIQLQIINDANEPLQNVEVKFKFPLTKGLHIEKRIPAQATRYTVKNYTQVLDNHSDKYPIVDHQANAFEVKSLLGALKHKQRHPVFLEPLRVWAEAALSGEEIPVSMEIHADNLPDPIVYEFSLKID